MIWSESSLRSNKAARYLVVGGVAVVLHGHPRCTADLDLVLALDPANLRRALDALRHHGYRPRAPVSLDEFLDPVTRRRWIEEKGMTVLSLSSPAIPTTEVDLLASEPFPFDAAYGRALRADLRDVVVTVASLPDLLLSSEVRVGRKISKTCESSRRSRGSWAEVSETKREMGTDEQHREQRRAWLRLTYRQRLEWLEQAKRFVARALEAARVRLGGAGRQVIFCQVIE